jgi:hypothetical protein
VSEPRVTITVDRVPIEGGQQKQLTDLFAHPGFEVLRTIIAAHARQMQVTAMNAGLYWDVSEVAKDRSRAAVAKAAIYASTLDVLDEIAAKQEEWFMAELK